MPYASKTNFVATNVTESSSPTAQILNGDMSEYIPLEGQAQIDKIKEYTQDDEKLGNFAKNILTQINSVDNLLLKRLASFYQNIAAGNATNEDFLII